MDPLAVYIHWPFCLNKCPYCDFNSHVAATIDHAAWRDAYSAEITHFAARTGRRKIQSVFFGGGTPSLMAPATVASCLAALAAHWSLDGDVEITLEANPTSVEAAKLRDFAAAGINRLSLGVQSLDAASLAFLGRQHGLAETRAAIETAVATFANWSMDLIYARPGQTAAAWRTELDDALAYGPSHLSAYQLTIEKGTPFFTDQRMGAFALPEDALGASLFEQTNTHLTDAGLPPYEISNYGASCRHNLAYWRYRDYAGIGPGAHGRLTLDGATHATRQIAAPENWRAQVATAGHGTQADTVLGFHEIRDETVMMGLRLTEGIPHAGLDLDPTRLAALADEGLLTIDATHIRATREGRARLNALLAHLLADEPAD